MSDVIRTETTNYADTRQYNPEKKYYFLSASDFEKVAWIRMPFMTRREVNETLKKMLDKQYLDKETGKWHLKYGNIEIFSEEDTLNKKSKYHCTDGEYHELTLREAIFGDRYEKWYERIINKPEFLDPNYFERRAKKKESSLEHTDD